MATSRHCGDCGHFWPQAFISCPLCKEKTGTSSHSPMDKSELSFLLYTKGIRDLTKLKEAEQKEIEAEWEMLRVEAERRGQTWTVPDLIEEFRPDAYIS